MPQLILYACPVGPLAAQIKTYFEVSQRLCGPNAAHAYMPHCTLTGFFEDEERAIALYTTALDSLLLQYQKHIPKPPIAITQLTFRADWHGLELEAVWLKQLVADFAEQATSPTRRSPLRLKNWLHLSLAYEFNPTCESALIQSARDLIDLSTPVFWEIRLYERWQSLPRESPTNRWRYHYSELI